MDESSQYINPTVPVSKVWSTFNQDYQDAYPIVRTVSDVEPIQY